MFNDANRRRMPLFRNSDIVLFRRIFILAPLVAVATLFLFALAVRVYWGAWPQPYNPDPKIPGLEVFHYVAVLTPIVAAAAFVLVPALIVGGKKRDYIAALMSWGLYVIVYMGNAFQLPQWLMD